MLTNISRTGEPITLDEAQEELRQRGRDFQRLTARNLTRAIRHVERRAQITLHSSAQWRMTLPDFPNYSGDDHWLAWHGWWDEKDWNPERYRVRSPILLPMPPWDSTDSVEYYDQNNQLQTVNAAQYQTSGSDTAPAELEFNDAFLHPPVYDRLDAVVITFKTGQTPDPIGITAATLYSHYLIDRDQDAKEESDRLIMDLRNHSFGVV